MISQKTGECYFRDDAGNLCLAESFVDMKEVDFDVLDDDGNVIQTYKKLIPVDGNVTTKTSIVEAVEAE